MNKFKNIKCRNDKNCLEMIENICQYLIVTPKNILYISRMFDLYSSILRPCVKRNLKVFYSNLCYQLEIDKKLIDTTKRSLLKRSFGSAFPEVNNIILSFI